MRTGVIPAHTHAPRSANNNNTALGEQQPASAWAGSEQQRAGGPYIWNTLNDLLMLGHNRAPASMVHSNEIRPFWKKSGADVFLTAANVIAEQHTWGWHLEHCDSVARSPAGRVTNMGPAPDPLHYWSSPEHGLLGTGSWTETEASWLRQVSGLRGHRDRGSDRHGGYEWVGSKSGHSLPDTRLVGLKLWCLCLLSLFTENIVEAEWWQTGRLRLFVEMKGVKDGCVMLHTLFHTDFHDEYG